MIEKKIVVPDEMLMAGIQGNVAHPAVAGCFQAGLEASLLWLSENPIVPTLRQILDILHEKTSGDLSDMDAIVIATEWQRRMFLAPEPEVPEAIKDLLHVDSSRGSSDSWNNAILEAYKRGKEGK